MASYPAIPACQASLGFPCALPNQQSSPPPRTLDQQTQPFKALAPYFLGALKAFLGALKASPFDEFKINNHQLSQKIDDLTKSGFFTVEISSATKKYLQELQTKPHDEWTHNGLGGHIDLSQTVYDEVLKKFAQQLYAKLCPKEKNTDLIAQETEIRAPANGGADSWHIDRAPKVLSCIATLKGPPTQYIEPSKTIGNSIPDEIHQKDIKSLPEGHFAFFVADSLENPDIPKLVHRAPKSEEQRHIFLARWRPNNRQPNIK